MGDRVEKELPMRRIRTFTGPIALALLLTGCASPPAAEKRSAATEPSDEPQPALTLDELEPDGQLAYAADTPPAREPSPPPSTDAGAPAATAAAEEQVLRPRNAAKAPDTYRVQPGDTLIKIARKLYAEDSRWRDIYQANRHQLSAPGQISVGMELQLPER
jgi:nucleoid-associated protein YgaU